MRTDIQQAANLSQKDDNWRLAHVIHMVTCYFLPSHALNCLRFQIIDKEKKTGHVPWDGAVHVCSNSMCPFRGPATKIAPCTQDTSDQTGQNLLFFLWSYLYIFLYLCLDRTKVLILLTALQRLYLIRHRWESIVDNFSADTRDPWEGKQ